MKENRSMLKQCGRIALGAAVLAMALVSGNGCRTTPERSHFPIESFCISANAMPEARAQTKKILTVRGYEAVSDTNSVITFERPFGHIASVIFPKAPTTLLHARLRANFFLVSGRTCLVQLVWSVVENPGAPSETEEPLDIGRTAFEPDFTELRDELQKEYPPIEKDRDFLL